MTTKPNGPPGLTLAGAVLALMSFEASAACGERVCFDRVAFLEKTATTSANASVGDVNGDGHLDIVLIKGRHWPAGNRLLLGDGIGGFSGRDLGGVEDRSYTGALADVDDDGDLDIVVSNDRPDPNPVYLNDGTGAFSLASHFGLPEWKTRNISLAHMNGDSLPDIVVANRGPLDGPSPNFICLNVGGGRFEEGCRAFSMESSTTITPADLNLDGWTDLVVPHRDGGQGHVYFRKPGKALLFDALPFGPARAAIRATSVADFDGDGLADIAAIHTGNSEGGDGVVDRGREYQGTTIYFGVDNGGFGSGVTIGGTGRMPYALTAADINRDGRMDLVVGHVEASTTVFLNIGGSARFDAIDLGDSDGASYGFAVADLDADGFNDIVIAKSGARNRLYFGSAPAIP